MTHLNKLRVLKWVSSDSVICCRIPFLPSGSFFYPARYYRANKLADDDKCSVKISGPVKEKAQAALVDYLQYTRNLQTSDAEFMIMNSPIFLGNLLQKIEVKAAKVDRSIARYLRYNPFNEFEPFFESLGLRPSQYKPLLPRNMMFLSDDELLLENFRTLCNYGIPRNKIGRILTEAGEVFSYDYGLLAMKLRAYEELGLDKAFMCKMVVYAPSLLIGDVNMDFVKSVEILRKGGIELNWIEENMSDTCSYDWSLLHSILNLFMKSGYSEEQLGRLLSLKPGLLFEGSWDRTLLLMGLLTKFGSSRNQIFNMFLEFPEIQVGKFLQNTRQCYLFLVEIEMDILEIGKIVRSHPLLLGSCALKKANSLLAVLSAGKKRVCDVILQNPQELKNWVVGSKVQPLPNSGERQRSHKLKSEFLLDLGIAKDSSGLEKALKRFRGNGAEFQERFDCIMQAGFNKKDVTEMIKVAPEILRQKKEVIKMKIDFLVNDLGYPISSLVTFPHFLCYTIPTIKLRLAMYNWLKDRKKVDPFLSLSTIISSSDKAFFKTYVGNCPEASKFWKNLKKKIDF